MFLLPYGNRCIEEKTLIKQYIMLCTLVHKVLRLILCIMGRDTSFKQPTGMFKYRVCHYRIKTLKGHNRPTSNVGVSVS